MGPLPGSPCRDPLRAGLAGRAPLRAGLAGNPYGWAWSGSLTSGSCRDTFLVDGTSRDQPEPKPDAKPKSKAKLEPRYMMMVRRMRIIMMMVRRMRKRMKMMAMRQWKGESNKQK